LPSPQNNPVTPKEAMIPQFEKFVNTVMKHWKGITNYSKYHISNGILEGTNSKIQLAKARARGYRNKNNFINMIYFIAGKLKFNYPLFSG
jgi:transposase